MDGVPARIFCGPAKATVEVQRGSQAPRTYRFRNGACRRYPRYFAVDVGTLAVGLRTKERLPYFGLLIGDFPFGEPEGTVVSKDGTYEGGVLAVYWSPRTSYSFSGEQLTVTLRNGRRAGEFVGRRRADPVFRTPSLKIRGSFTC